MVGNIITTYGITEGDVSDGLGHNFFKLKNTPTLLEDSHEKEIANEWGPPNAVTAFQIKAFLKMAKVCKRDVFYDLGSGHGRVVRLAVTRGKVKKAIGIEHVSERFCHARMLAKKHLTKRQLATVDFYFAELDDLKRSDMTGATVAYYGLDPDKDEVRMFRKLFGKRRMRIIRKDLPVIGYAPIALAWESSTTKFFLMSYPFKHRIRSKDNWAKSFLGPKASINDVFNYYSKQLKKRDVIDHVQMVRELRKLVKSSFKK